MMTTPYTALGILWLVYGALGIAKGVWLLLYRPVLRLMWGALIDRVPDPFTWMAAFDTLLLLAIAVMLIAAVFSVLAGWSLVARKPSGRPLVLIAAFLALLTGPLGVALGVYTLVVMLGRHRVRGQDSLAPAA